MANPAIINSYSTLKNALEDHMNRTDVADEGVAAMAIDLAEAKLNRVVQHPRRVARNDSFTIDSQYETLPSDFWALNRISISGTVNQPLIIVSPQEMDEQREILSATGKPTFVSVVGTEFEFCAAPDQSYTGLLVYTQSLPPLASNSTNWLLDIAPDVYLYAAISESYAWAQDDARSMQYLQKTQQALQELRISGAREAYGATPRSMPRSFG